MPANISPIFTNVPNSGWGTIDTANTAKDGTGTVVEIFTAGSNGSKVERIIAETLGTNVASVLRVFLNNGGANSVPANNTLIRQISLPSTTISEVAGQITIMVPLDIVIEAGYKLNITIGTTVAAGWQVSALGGDY